MSTSSDLHVIVGLGVTGLSCARFLKSQQIPFAITDSRTNPPQLEEFQKANPTVEVAVGEISPSLLTKAAKIILSPGVALASPAIAAQVKMGKPVIGDIELFAQASKSPVIAITGTNAKSTVTTLVGQMVSASGQAVQVGGNLGVPVLDLYAQNPQAQAYVLELSSFQLETTYTLQPTVATVLNITPDHMDRYATVADYQQAKHRVYQHCKIAVCNADDPLTDTAVKQKFTFTLSTPGAKQFGLLVKDGETYLAFESTPLMPVRDLPVIGRHYQANALAALALGHAYGLPMDGMLNVLRTFPGLPHRCEFVREIEQVKWYNDSKGTNVGATQAAIEGLGSEIEGKLILIAGGIGKNADFSSLAPLIEKYVRHVVLIGEAAEEIGRQVHKPVTASFAKNIAEAVQQCQGAAEPGDCVLLSPACASFDMFKNFEHRGEVFMNEVKNL